MYAMTRKRRHDRPTQADRSISKASGALPVLVRSICVRMPALKLVAVLSAVELSVRFNVVLDVAVRDMVVVVAHREAAPPTKYPTPSVAVAASSLLMVGPDSP